MGCLKAGEYYEMVQAFERSVLAASSSHVRPSRRRDGKTGRGESKNGRSVDSVGMTPSTSAVGGDFVDPVGSYANGSGRTGLAVISDEGEGAEGAAVPATPDPQSLIQHVHRRML